MRRMQWKSSHLLAVILLVGLVNFSGSIGWGLPQSTSPETVSPWPVDVIAPVAPLNEAYHRFSRGDQEWVIYPLFHYIVLDAAYAPYVLTQLVSGGLKNPSSEFPYGVESPASFFTALTVIARCVSLGMAILTILLVFLIGKSLFSEAAGLWAAALTALIGPFAYYASTSNLDVPYLFWTLVAAYFFTQLLKHNHLRSYAWFAVSAGLAVATKDQAYAYFLLPMLVAMVHQRLYRSQHVADNTTLPAHPMWQRALYLVVPGALAFAFANNLFLGGWDGFLRHLEFEFAFVSANLTETTVPEASESISASVLLIPVLTQALGPATLILGIAGIARAVRRRNREAILFLSLPLSYYLFFLETVDLPYVRHYLGLMIIVAIYAGDLVASWIKEPGWQRTTALGLAVLAISTQLLHSINVTYTLLQDSRYAMEAWINENVPPGSVIESQVQVRYLPRLSEVHSYEISGNAYDAIDYSLAASDLTGDALSVRDPDYILILRNIGLTGDPDTDDRSSVQRYYSHLLAGRFGYTVVAEFETPSLLWYRQITAGTEPTAILLGHQQVPESSSGHRPD